MVTVSDVTDLALEHFRAGRVDLAEQLCREVLDADPRPATLNRLGLTCHQVGRHALALHYIGQAIQLAPDFAEAHNNRGIVFLAQGNLEEAAASLQRSLSLKPDVATTHNNLGNAFRRLKKLDQAVASLRQALRLQPDLAEAHNNLGIALVEQGQLAAAVDSFQTALALKPDYPEACFNLATALHARGDLEATIFNLQRALQLKPDFAAAYNSLGVALKCAGRLNDAAVNLQQVLRLQPDFSAAYCNLGSVQIDQGQFDDAVISLQHALRLQPELAAAHYNLGLAFLNMGRPAESIPCLQQALRLRPDFAEAQLNLALAFRNREEPNAIIARFQRAVQLKPDSAAAHNNLGNALLQEGRLDEAVASLEQALHFKPDYAEARQNLGMAWLLGGNYEQGWPEYEWRLQCKPTALPQFEQPRWDGSPLEGRTVLLLAEQGLGDTLQFIRYTTLVRDRGGRVLAAIPNSLRPLLSRCAGIDQFTSSNFSPPACPASLPEFDVYCPLLSLPGILQTTLATIPADVPYLFADADLKCHWQQELNNFSSFRIGIAWQGDPHFWADRQRSIPLARFAPLVRFDGVQVFSLQKGFGTEQLEAFTERSAVVELGSRLDVRDGAFMDTAAIMESLDLVITSDTAIAHLAGGLGVPVWVVLPFAPDWRWLLYRDDSPWYPSMRLFRQTESGNWDEVFERLVAELRTFIAHPTQSGRPSVAFNRNQ